jgi:outer membrane protein OmpA-like peptidoglycan-associated protein
MDYLRKMFLVFCLLASASFAEAASGVISEQIYFLGDDGLHALVYTTSRSEYPNYNMWFQNREGFEREDYIRNFLYIYPKEYTWDTVSKKGFTLLKFPGKNFAGLERIELEPSLQVNEDGVFHFSNWRNKVKTPDGHYGLWNSPDDFKKISYTWVFPATLEPVEYKANCVGEWVFRHNTITYYGSNVNDLVFDIKYQPSSQKTYESLKEKLTGEEVEIAQEPSGIKISVAATVLFPSGVGELSDKGKPLLTKVAETLKGRTDVNIIVEGHTDNVPITGQLVSKFPTNWELASIRSINVVHFLVEKGIKEAQLESRSFSFYRPIASNDTVEGREKNRRIELLIEENSEKESSSK